MVAVIEPAAPPPVPVPTTAASNASIDAYLSAGDNMAKIMGVTMWIGAALIVLIAAAWLIGLLPAAVRVF